MLAVIAITLFVNVACARDGSDALHGSWYYASGESEGRTSSVSGDLKFTADGKFEDNRYIGGIGGFRKGSYRVSGDKLTLNSDNGDTQTYRFSFGTTQSGGKKVETLLLRGTGLSFILGRKEG